MTIKRAYDITRDFILHRRPSSPIKNKMFKIIHMNNEAHIIDRDRSWITIKTISVKKLEKILKSKQYNIQLDDEPVVMIGGDRYISYSFNIPYTLTSIGLVTEAEFLLAEDIIEQQETIRKRDLIVGDRYLSISGKKYLYMGQMEYIYEEADFTLEINYLYDLKLNKFVQNDSVRLIEYIGENKEGVRINSMEVLTPNIFMYADFRTKTKINNVSFTL